MAEQDDFQESIFEKQTRELRETLIEGARDLSSRATARWTAVDDPSFGIVLVGLPDDPDCTSNEWDAKVAARLEEMREAGELDG